MVTLCKYDIVGESLGEAPPTVMNIKDISALCKVRRGCFVGLIIVGGAVQIFIKTGNEILPKVK